MGVKELLRPTKKKILITAIIFIAYQLIVIFVPFYFVVQSNAMSPAIKIGDIIFISGVSFENLKIGDVALFYPPTGRVMVAHRVVSIDYDNGTFATKGDNNNGQIPFEKSISSNNLYGIVVGTVPAIGYLDLFYVGWIIRILIIYLIVSLIFRGPKPNSAASQGKQ